MIRQLHTATLASLLLLVGCGKGGGKSSFSDEELAANPAANFQAGVTVVQSPDKKTGAVDYTAAYTRFNAAANLGAGPKASFNAGLAAEKLGKLDDAAHHYGKAYEADPAYEAAMFSYARVLQNQGKHADAAAIYGAAADANGDDSVARNRHISSLIRAGDHDGAYALAQDILRTSPDDALVFRNLSGMYYDQERYGLSQLAAEKALALNDADPGLYNNMGVTLMIQGNEPAAIEKFQTAIKLSERHFEANMNLGTIALNSGDYARAKECFERALSSNGTDTSALMGMAVALRGVKDYKTAGDLYDEIIDANPELRAAYFNASILYEKYVKDFSKAKKYLDAYRKAFEGQVSPTDEVFARAESIRVAEEAVAEQKRIEAERKRAEEERQARNAALLSTVAETIVAMGDKLRTFEACLDAGSVEEVGLILEQAQFVVDSEDADLAPDINQILQSYAEALDAATVDCEPGSSAPESAETPADAGEEAESTEEAAASDGAVDGDESPNADTEPAQP